MASNRVSDIDDSDTETRLPSPDSPRRNRQPNANDSDDSEVIINRNARQRRKSRSRETVNIARTELNGLYAEMRQLRNEVRRVRNRTHRLDTDHGHYTDDFNDEELDMNNNETPDNRLDRTDDFREDQVPHEEHDPHEEPNRHPFTMAHSYGRGDDRTLVQKPKKPATYSGKTGWREYLIHFEMVAEFNRWDDRTKAFELALSLRDDAQVTLSDLKPQERKNYSSIVTALTSRFEPEDQSELFRSELRSRFRRKDEPLTEFAQDVKRLVRLAYPNTDIDVRDTLARNAFEDSLNDADMEWAVHQGKPKSIETAVKLALEFEAFRGSRKQLNPSRSNKAPMRVQIEEPIQANKSNNYSHSRNRDTHRIPKLCTYCTKRGHLENDCYTKQRALELRRSEMNKGTNQNQGNC